MKKRGAARAAGAVSAARTRSLLLAWFRANARDLPWRSPAPRRSSARRDPWRVWASEIMLQQTRVEAVVEPYRRFVAAFPTLAAIAKAPQADVLARWSGLGYYRRARLLHAGARHVAEQHAGAVPRTRAELEKVPGIGSYTAGAILSIAFGEREPALDANVTRVVARLLAVRDVRSREGRLAIERFARELVDCDAPGDVNEALMDLGSAVCTARDARCAKCPLRSICRGRGFATEIPAPRARKTPRKISLGCAVVRDGERVLFLRRPEGDALLAGMWDLPTIDLAEAGERPEAELRALVRSRSGFDARLEGPLVTVRHDIVGRKIEARVYVAPAKGRRRASRDVRMLAASDLDAVGVPALPVKILRALARETARSGATGRRAPARST